MPGYDHATMLTLRPSGVALGDPSFLMTAVELKRFILSFVATPTGCWNWTERKQTKGYGRFSLGDSEQGAHRVSYRIFVGPIPDEMTIDHLCNNPSCVNPDHLAIATLVANTMRGTSPAALNARKTHCSRGHEFTPENTRTSKDGRKCRACDREMKRRIRLENPEKYRAEMRNYGTANSVRINAQRRARRANRDTSFE